jgi:hypothetical protein
METNYHFVLERVSRGLLHSNYVPSGDHVVDELTLFVRSLENFK